MTPLIPDVLAVALLLSIFVVGSYFLVIHPQPLGNLLARLGNSIEMMIHQSVEGIKAKLNDFNVKKQSAPRIFGLEEYASSYKRISEEAPGWLFFLEEAYLSEGGIKEKIFKVDMHAADVRERMRTVAAEHIRRALTATYENITDYHREMKLSAQDRSAEENDDLKNRCELFEEITADLANRLEKALNQHEQRLQATDRLRRQSAALQAAKTSIELQQAEIKKQEEDLEAEWQRAFGEAQELNQARHTDVAQEMEILPAMNIRNPFRSGQDLADKQRGDKKDK